MAMPEQRRCEAEDNREFINKSIKTAQLHAQYMERQDLEFLGKYLTKYITGWWD